MAHHGYLREFDETYDRDEDRASGWRNREGERGLLFGGERRAGVSSHSDEHYRSWRDQQMRAMDRDYADYRREREEQFHHDFEFVAKPAARQPAAAADGDDADRPVARSDRHARSGERNGGGNAGGAGSDGSRDPRNLLKAPQTKVGAINPQ